MPTSRFIAVCQSREHVKQTVVDKATQESSRVIQGIDGIRLSATGPQSKPAEVP